MLVGSVNMKNEGLFKKALKKGAAWLLSAAMTTTLFSGAMPIKAFAATELQNPGISSTGQNDNMEYSWKVSGDFGEAVNSYRYNFKSRNGNGSTAGVTYQEYGTPLYILMPTAGNEDGAKNGTLSIPGTRPSGYNPNSNYGGYYMAKMGQRQAELSSGNAITGSNQSVALSGTTWNGAVETTKFGSGSDERTIETMVTTTADEKYVYADYYFNGL